MRGILVSHEMAKAFDSLTREGFSRAGGFHESFLDLNPSLPPAEVKIFEPSTTLIARHFSDLSNKDKGSEPLEGYRY